MIRVTIRVTIEVDIFKIRNYFPDLSSKVSRMKTVMRDLDSVKFLHDAYTVIAVSFLICNEVVTSKRSILFPFLIKKCL